MSMLSLIGDNLDVCLRAPDEEIDCVDWVTS